jgi:transcriptional regulator with XRE-family HTH domain
MFAKRGALKMARAVEIGHRRNEARAVRRISHFDLQPPAGIVGANGSRKQLAPDPELVLLGRYLRRSRLLAERSQDEVSRQSGVSQSGISQAEHGLAGGMTLRRFTRMVRPLDRLFPLGQCPHDHVCPWQPFASQEWVVKDTAAFLDQLLKYAGVDT